MSYPSSTLNPAFPATNSQTFVSQPQFPSNFTAASSAFLPRPSPESDSAFHIPAPPSSPQAPNISSLTPTPNYPFANAYTHQPPASDLTPHQISPICTSSVPAVYPQASPKILPLSQATYPQSLGHMQPQNVHVESIEQHHFLTSGNPPPHFQSADSFKQYQPLSNQTSTYYQSINQPTNLQASNQYRPSAYQTSIYNQSGDQPTNSSTNSPKMQQTLPYQASIYNQSMNQPAIFPSDTSNQYQTPSYQTAIQNQSGNQLSNVVTPSFVTNSPTNLQTLSQISNISAYQPPLLSAASLKNHQHFPPQSEAQNKLEQQMSNMRPQNFQTDVSKSHQFPYQQSPASQPPPQTFATHPYSQQSTNFAPSNNLSMQQQIRNSQQFPQAYGGIQSSDFNSNNCSPSIRVPGKKLNSSEWALLTSPIDLLADYNLLPSDGPVAPPKPPITSDVNCDPDLMRCTLTAVPVTSKLLSQCRLPLGLLIHPFRDVNELPVINTSVIVRCRSCRTYINPFVRFLDGGRRWRCPVCTLSNTVPDEFFYDPATQSYGDPSRRPEIQSATVEFIAPQEYTLRPPQAATYLFCFEVSRNAVVTGYLDFVCNLLAKKLSKLPGDARRQIAFLTYDSGLHFYILSGNRMKMVICQDLSEIFLPDVEGMINRINDNMETLSSFLQNLPKEFSNTFDTGNCLGFVLQTALKMIGTSGGRVTIFNTSLPIDGPGSLQFREEKEDLTQPNVKHLGPTNDFYKTLALDFAATQTTVDLFFLNARYCDIATISGVARHCGGSVFHYPDFYHSTVLENSADPKKGQCRNFLEVENLRRDFSRYLTRRIGFEAVLRIRCTRGLNIQNFFGSFFVRSVDLLSLPNVNPDAGYAMQLEISESLEDFPTVVLQAALLYTSTTGDRRIRVHTLCLPVTDSPAALYNFSDQSAIACLVTKMAVERSITAGVLNAREALCTVVSDILTSYQKNNNLASGGIQRASQCSPALRLLPAFICGALRFEAFAVHSLIALDVRSAALELLINAPCSQIETLIYPNLYDLRCLIQKIEPDAPLTLAQKAAGLSLNDQTSKEVEDSSDDEDLPDTNFVEILNLKAESIARDGIYLLNTGNAFFLLVGYGINTEILMSLLGLSTVDDIRVDETALELPALPEGALVPKPRRRLENLLRYLRKERAFGTSLVLLRHDAPEFLKTRFVNSLIEDRTESAPSYYEFLQILYRLSQS